MNDRVICLKCADDGETSIVEELGSMRTLMYSAPFYDQEGRRHHHDSNISTTGFRCSRGHSWETKSKGSCWCGWPALHKSNEP